MNLFFSIYQILEQIKRIPIRATKYNQGILSLDFIKKNFTAFEAPAIELLFNSSLLTNSNITSNSVLGQQLKGAQFMANAMDSNKTQMERFDVFITKLDQLIQYNNKPISGSFFINASIEINLENDLILIAKKNIVFQKNGCLVIKGARDLYLKSGIENKDHDGKVIFDNNIPQIFLDEGRVIVHGNPEQLAMKHKYTTPYFYGIHVTPITQSEYYMLINDVYDLHNTRVYLSGNYALSTNIDGSVFKHNTRELGFMPISLPKKNIPFTGKFDGNGFTISGIDITCNVDNVTNNLFKGCGIFGTIAGQSAEYSEIKNLNIKNCTVKGDHYVGVLFGVADNLLVQNVNVSNSFIFGRSVVGSIGGEASNIKFINNQCSDNILNATEYIGTVLGSGTCAEFYNMSSCMQLELPLVGYVNEG